MKALVTGLGGFLGGELARQLQAEGWEVVGLSRRPLPEWEARGVRVVLGDLQERSGLIEATRACDAVFHAAARAGVWGSYADFFGPNVEGTRNVLEACRASEVPRLIYTSTPSVTFDGREAEGADESKPYPTRPWNFYSETKAEAEALVLAANGRRGVATVALRPHLIWGPGDPHLLPRMLRAADAGRLRRIGDGRNRVDTTFIVNAAAAHLAAARGLEPTAPQAGRAYFISDGQPVELWSWIDQLLQGTGRPPVRGSVSRPAAEWLGMGLEWVWRTLRLPGEPPLTRFSAAQLGLSHWYDVSAARRDFGFEPPVSFEEALRQTLAAR